MAILHIGNIPESLFERVKRIAEARGKSLDAVVIDLLEELDRAEIARQNHTKMMQTIRDNMAHREPLPGGLTAADIIRENREEREAQLTQGL